MLNGRRWWWLEMFGRCQHFFFNRQTKYKMSKSKNTPMHTGFKMCASLLRDRGYTIWHGAQFVPHPNSNDIDFQSPDIIALHPWEAPLRIFIDANTPSGIWKEMKSGGTLIHCTGYTDLSSLLTTGRPAKRAANELLF